MRPDVPALPAIQSAPALFGSSPGGDNTGSFWKGTRPFGRISIHRQGRLATRRGVFSSMRAKRLPFLDEVWYTIISTGQPRWLLFTQGYLDASGHPPGAIRPGSHEDDSTCRAIS